MSDETNPNTSGGYRAALSFKKPVEGDKIAEAFLFELARRSDVEIDIETIIKKLESGRRFTVTQAVSSSATEVTLGWSGPFDKLDYDWNFYFTAINQDEAPQWFLKARTGESMTFGFKGLTAEANVALAIREN